LAGDSEPFLAARVADLFQPSINKRFKSRATISNSFGRENNLPRLPATPVGERDTTTETKAFKSQCEPDQEKHLGALHYSDGLTSNDIMISALLV